MTREMKELNLKEIHEILLDILLDVDDFCRERNLRYSLSYGTLLGAVRHKGYIPWDDDVDLMMPRPDFERFVATYGQRGPYNCLYMENSDRGQFIQCYAKVQDIRTVSIERKRSNVYRFGLNLDIFPVDVAPADAALHETFAKTVTRFRHRIYLSQRPFFPFTFHDPLIPKIQAHRHSPLWWAQQCEEYLKQYAASDSPYAGPVSDGMGTVEIFRQSLFADYVTLPFEGHRLQAIADWETFLVQMYGDYMTLPPENKRRTHGLTAWWK